MPCLDSKRAMTWARICLPKDAEFDQNWSYPMDPSTFLGSVLGYDLGGWVPSQEVFGSIGLNSSKSCWKWQLFIVFHNVVYMICLRITISSDGSWVSKTSFEAFPKAFPAVTPCWSNGLAATWCLDLRSHDAKWPKWPNGQHVAEDVIYLASNQRWTWSIQHFLGMICI